MIFVKRRQIWFSFILFLNLFIASVALGKDELFPLDKVKPGLKGEGYTVFEGTKVEPFKVEVLQVVSDGSEFNQYILARLSGEKVERYGGLAAGMSGSPVYIKGKLVGAISYGFENADSMLAMITPIETMLKLLPSMAVSQAVKGKEPEVLRETQQIAGITGLKPVPVAAPVMVSGMNRRGFELVQQALKSERLQPVFLPGATKAAATAGAKKVPVKLEPGSAITVQLVTGDYQVAAIGTVTWIGSDYWLAFGHPFMGRGIVDYQACFAEVFQTVNSPVMSFKIGAGVESIGRVIQDRTAGIVGRLGEDPQFIEVELEVFDEQLYPGLIIAGVTAGIDRGIDRVGAGTAKVAVEIENAAQSLIRREDVFYGEDIAFTCLKDLDSLLKLLANNEFAATELHKVHIKVEVKEDQTSARLVKLEADRTKIKPGGTLGLTATVRRFRGSTAKVVFKVLIPEDSKPGEMVFTLRGGSEMRSAEKPEDDLKFIDPKEETITSLAALLDDYVAGFKNDQLVLEYFPQTSNKKEAAVKEPRRYPADFGCYVTGEVQATVEIL